MTFFCIRSIYKNDFDEVKGEALYQPMLRYQHKHVPAETAKVTCSRH